MEVQSKHFDEVFDFKGKWDVPSKCGLRILDRNGKSVVIVTEIYQYNPGSSVTYAGGLLLEQICSAKGLDPDNVIYIECNPDTKSRLSFYAEEYYRVDFSRENGQFINPTYKQLSDEEINELIFNEE
ncbi:MAG: hypothetical protein WCQ69_08320 [Bacteroidales bacterium]|jgi:hypothetical protein|nr:hypothetical protein [Bacteroidales bacterium]MDD2264296.1 hypothetical protein [Bacteroidales bacterium]MDD2831530.1 hypothetical protein [Bacteroidales bacterium]MDD3208524.1 hypothetical protein [Bacteroidales bacterium]MDD3697063.1 hypothetical protein [Bacteroidales bacterium]